MDKTAELTKSAIKPKKGHQTDVPLPSHSNTKASTMPKPDFAKDKAPIIMPISILPTRGISNRALKKEKEHWNWEMEQSFRGTSKIINWLVKLRSSMRMDLFLRVSWRTVKRREKDTTNPSLKNTQGNTRTTRNKEKVSTKQRWWK